MLVVTDLKDLYSNDDVVEGNKKFIMSCSGGWSYDTNTLGLLANIDATNMYIQGADSMAAITVAYIIMNTIIKTEEKDQVKLKEDFFKINNINTTLGFHSAGFTHYSGSYNAIQMELVSKPNPFYNYSIKDDKIREFLYLLDFMFSSREIEHINLLDIYELAHAYDHNDYRGILCFIEKYEDSLINDKSKIILMYLRGQISESIFVHYINDRPMVMISQKIKEYKGIE